MKLWVDDVRSAPNGYVQCKSVNEAKCWVEASEVHLSSLAVFELIDCKSAFKADLLSCLHTTDRAFKHSQFYKHVFCLTVLIFAKFIVVIILNY